MLSFTHLSNFSFLAVVFFTAPSEAPKELKGGRVTRTSIAISWVAPSQASFNGHLMGYKVSHQACCVTLSLSRNQVTCYVIYDCH